MAAALLHIHRAAKSYRMGVKLGNFLIDRHQNLIFCDWEWTSAPSSTLAPQVESRTLRKKMSRKLGIASQRRWQSKEAANISKYEDGVGSKETSDTEWQAFSTLGTKYDSLLRRNVPEDALYHGARNT
ncbi:hypothetical protein O1611_g9531 [Lasiodiplodia mahajangana]|uniref:Uncharacterized protein n=1 Tax=Lasiodiplodia mahajangana TaxID=1108764 RepID=A0ACC2J8E0_9PEZI|nr:hypothetical protein O1611_g9531 [Lasiodiplodia mahajangana]